jgi:hypothetical protein
MSKIAKTHRHSRRPTQAERTIKYLQGEVVRLQLRAEVAEAKAGCFSALYECRRSNSSKNLAKLKKAESVLTAVIDKWTPPQGIPTT